MANGFNIPAYLNQTTLQKSASQAAATLKPISVKAHLDFGNVSKFHSPLGKITGQVDDFTKSMEAANARVTAFAGTAAVLATVSGAIRGVVTNTILLEKRLTDLQIVFGSNAKETERFGRSLFDVAKKTGQSFEAVFEAATEFSRQGLGVTDTLKRTQNALTLTRLTGLDTATAVKGLTAAWETYGETLRDTTEILDKWAALDVKTAVSSADFVNAIQRSGAVAREAGVSFEELTALVAIAKKETQRDGAVLGNAFKSIFTTLRTDRALLEDISKTYKIDFEFEDGSLRGALDLMKELAVKMKDMPAGVEKATLLKRISGGKYHVNVANAVMGNLGGENGGDLPKFMGYQSDSMGAAAAKTDVMNKTLDVLIKRLQASSQEFAGTFGKFAFGDEAKSVINFINNGLERMNELLDPENTDMTAKAFRGIAKAIGNVVSGPGLALLAFIFTKLFKDFAVFGVNSAATFLKINQKASETRAIEENILTALSRNEGFRVRILSLQGNELAQRQAILQTYAQEAGFQKMIAGVAATQAKGVYSSGFRATPGGVTQNYPNKAIPTNLSGMLKNANQLPATAVFNKGDSAIDDAIHRERNAGLPMSRIRINTDKRLRAADNPLGIAVTNTRDEPFGKIPNFAGGGGKTVKFAKAAANVGLQALIGDIMADGMIDAQEAIQLAQATVTYGVDAVRAAMAKWKNRRSSGNGASRYRQSPSSTEIEHPKLAKNNIPNFADYNKDFRRRDRPDYASQSRLTRLTYDEGDMWTFPMGHSFQGGKGFAKRPKPFGDASNIKSVPSSFNSKIASDEMIRGKKVSAEFSVRDAILETEQKIFGEKVRELADLKKYNTLKAAVEQAKQEIANTKANLNPALANRSLVPFATGQTSNLTGPFNDVQSYLTQFGKRLKSSLGVAAYHTSLFRDKEGWVKRNPGEISNETAPSLKALGRFGKRAHDVSFEALQAAAQKEYDASVAFDPKKAAKERVKAAQEDKLKSYMEAGILKGDVRYNEKTNKYIYGADDAKRIARAEAINKAKKNKADKDSIANANVVFDPAQHRRDLIAEKSKTLRETKLKEYLSKNLLSDKVQLDPSTNSFTYSSKDAARIAKYEQEAKQRAEKTAQQEKRLSERDSLKKAATPQSSPTEFVAKMFLMQTALSAVTGALQGFSDSTDDFAAKMTEAVGQVGISIIGIQQLASFGGFGGKDMKKISMLANLASQAGSGNGSALRIMTGMTGRNSVIGSGDKGSMISQAIAGYSYGAARSKAEKEGKKDLGDFDTESLGSVGGFAAKIGAKLSGRLGGLGTGIARVGGLFTRFIPILGQVVLATNALSSVFNIFGIDLKTKFLEAIGYIKSPAEEAAKSLKEFSKAATDAMAEGRFVSLSTALQEAVDEIRKQKLILGESDPDKRAKISEMSAKEALRENFDATLNDRVSQILLNLQGVGTKREQVFVPNLSLQALGATTRDGKSFGKMTDVDFTTFSNKMTEAQLKNTEAVMRSMLKSSMIPQNLQEGISRQDISSLIAALQIVNTTFKSGKSEFYGEDGRTDILDSMMSNLTDPKDKQRLAEMAGVYQARGSKADQKSGFTKSFARVSQEYGEEFWTLLNKSTKVLEPQKLLKQQQDYFKALRDLLNPIEVKELSLKKSEFAKRLAVESVGGEYVKNSEAAKAEESLKVVTEIINSASEATRGLKGEKGESLFTSESLLAALGTGGGGLIQSLNISDAEEKRKLDNLLSNTGPLRVKQAGESQALENLMGFQNSSNQSLFKIKTSSRDFAANSGGQKAALTQAIEKAQSDFEETNEPRKLIALQKAIGGLAQKEYDIEFNKIALKQKDLLSFAETEEEKDAINKAIAAELSEAAINYANATDFSKLIAESAAKTAKEFSDFRKSISGAQDLRVAKQNAEWMDKAIADGSFQIGAAEKRETSITDAKTAYRAAQANKFSTRQEIENARLGVNQAQGVGSGSFSQGAKSFTYDLEQSQKDFAYNLGKKIPEDFASGMARAFDAMLMETDNLGEALRGIALDFLSSIRQAFLQQASSNIVSSVVSGFASGGYINRGSGTKDDVPALLMKGEYVVNKNSVDKYGKGFFEHLNSGKIQKFATGGIAMPSAGGGGSIVGSSNLLGFATQQYTSGKDDIIAATRAGTSIALEDESRRLSFAALSGQTGSVRTAEVQQAKDQAIDLVIADSEARAAAKKASKEGNKQLLRSLLATAASAGMSYGTTQYKGFGTAASANNASTNQFQNYRIGALPAGTQYANSGGIILRGDRIRDGVPAMLTGNEYVMNNRAVSKYGKGFMDRVNSQRLNDGTPVTNVAPSQVTTTGNTIVNITVNSENGNVTADTASSDGKSDRRKEEELAQKIKQVVLRTITEEKRVSGTLRRA